MGPSWNSTANTDRNADGMTATLPFIQEIFDRFNALCFEGCLPPIPIVLTRAGSFLGKVEFKAKRGLFGLMTSKQDFRMKISTGFDLPVEELEDVVLHEMIHYYILLNNIRDTSAHGRTFRSIMARINADYGRHITIRHKADDVQRIVKPGRPVKYNVCVTTFRDGRQFVTVAANTRISALNNFYSRCRDIADVRWYETSDPFFSRFPRARTPKVYGITPEDLERHLTDNH